MSATLTIPNDPAELNQLRQLFDQASFTYPGIYRALKLPEGAPLSRHEHPLYAKRLSGDDPLGVIIVLFIFGMPVARDVAEKVLGAEIIDILDQTGLAQLSRGQVRSDIRIQPHEGFYFVVDPPFGRGKPDDVLGIGPSGNKLSSLTVRKQVKTALDLGCGCGLQALLAARHSERVVAVDISQRSVQFTRFNAGLNAVNNLEVRLGDLFEPVANEQFDLIVCNPPFVVSPEESVIYRDSGLPVNGIVRRILADLPNHLTDGGFGHVTCHWAHREEAEWWGPVSDLISPSGCHAWLARQITERPADYAIRWNRQTLRENPRRYQQTIERWYEWYRESGITAITSAFVALNKQTKHKPWIHHETVSKNPSGTASEQIIRIFSAQTHLSTLVHDDELLAEKFHIAVGTQIAEQSAYQSGELTLVESEIRCVPGIGATVRLDVDMTRVVKSLDSDIQLRGVLSHVAMDHGSQLEALTQLAVPIIRKLYSLGLIDRA
jgi:SAM-dependent methyltransferase